MLPKSCRPREKRIADLTPVTCSIPGFCAITGQSKAAVLCSIDDGSLYRCAPMVGGRATQQQASCGPKSPADPRTTTAHAASSAG